MIECLQGEPHCVHGLDSWCGWQRWYKGTSKYHMRIHNRSLLQTECAPTCYSSRKNTNLSISQSPTPSLIYARSKILGKCLQKIQICIQPFPNTFHCHTRNKESYVLSMQPYMMVSHQLCKPLHNLRRWNLTQQQRAVSIMLNILKDFLNFGNDLIWT